MKNTIKQKFINTVEKSEFEIIKSEIIESIKTMGLSDANQKGLLKEIIVYRYTIICVEKAKINNKMEQGITWEECCDRFNKVVMFYTHHEFNTWDYFTNIYNVIPQEHRLKIMLLEIYTCYHYREQEFYHFLKRILNEETEKQRKDRMKENKKTLKKYLDKENFITLYRGENANSLDEEHAISYTPNKSIAEWFSNRRASEYKGVIENEFHLSDILLYTNVRKEEEAMVIPDCVWWED
ncbi:hypothetical protein LL037_18770 [Clostridium estertheticum]|uniref:hypothetical protein n=1 Tax=Clostridium estertheticum TaxID=238834 RepID=UPI001C0AD710|nr:hypothetical protein [Clostridium estertheticum]MBU3198513.1 hypothetical protein [Clostridium estertheticum]WAG64494.1 hypothetical protein LL037_18770 [Clostridium estertheticum]